MKPPPMLWHYTTGDRLPAILGSGVLRPSSVNAERTGERPAVWFSRRRDWDPAVGGGIARSEEDLARALDGYKRGGLRGAIEALGPGESPEKVGGIARLGVAPETAPLTWADYVRRGGLPGPMAAHRETVDRELGSDPEDWRISLEPVPASKWLRVEWRTGTREGERWREVPRDAHAAELVLRLGRRR